MKRRAGTRQKIAAGIIRQCRRLSVEALETRRLLALDFGDAPPPYPVVEEMDGARHEVVRTWTLQQRIPGNFIEAESGRGLAISGVGVVLPTQN